MRVLQMLTAAFLVAAVSSNVQAASLSEVVEEYATVFSKFLKENGENKVAIDNFQGPRIGTGKSIATQLIDALRAKGIQVVDSELDASYVIRGNHSQQPDGAFPVVGVEIKIVSTETNVEEKSLTRRVRLKFGQDIAKIEEVRGEEARPIPQQSVAIDKPEEVEQITAPSFDASAARSQSERDDVLQKGLQTPGFQSFVNTDTKTQSLIAAAATSQFKVQLLVDRPGPDGQYDGIYEPLAIEKRSDLAFAPFQKGDRYAVELINESDFDVGVALEIDGINSLSLSEVSEFRQVGKWVVPQKSRGIIKGYHLDNRRVASFLVDTADQQETQLRRLGPPSNIGTVSVAFFAAWNVGEEPPPFAKSLGNTRNLITVPGPKIENPTETVAKQFCQQSLARVTVRYSNPQPSDQGAIQQVKRPEPPKNADQLNAQVR